MLLLVVARAVRSAAAPARRIISVAVASDERVYKLLKNKSQLQRSPAVLVHHRHRSFLAESLAKLIQSSQPELSRGGLRLLWVMSSVKA